MPIDRVRAAAGRRTACGRPRRQGWCQPPARPGGRTPRASGRLRGCPI